jgi:hypothetical protein
MMVGCEYFEASQPERESEFPTTAHILLVSLMASVSAKVTAESSTAAKPRKRFVGSKVGPSSRALASSTIVHQVPRDILEDVQLNSAIRALPANYSFEIHKTIHHVRKNKATMVALQMPEGLQMFACSIADIIERCVPKKKTGDRMSGDLPLWTLGLRTL